MLVGPQVELPDHRQPVEELLIVDPQAVDWMGLEAREYKHVQRSRLIELGLAELAQRLGWPPPAS